MTFKKKLFVAAAVLAAVIFVAGMSTLATSNYGTETDPLVTLSYLNQTVIPKLETSAEESAAQAGKELETSLDGSISEFEGNISTMLDAVDAATGSFTVVTLSSGQTVTCSVGTEIMLRVGKAVTAGKNSPRLIDETSGSALSSAGESLVKNHMYIVTIQQNGIKATANNTKVLIRGTYTVS